MARMTNGFFAAFCVLALLAGCTQNESSSKVSLQLPDFSKLNSSGAMRAGKVGSMTTPPPVELIVVTVTGQGIASPIEFKWQPHPGGLTPPTNVPMVVPRGSQRLLQAFAYVRGNRVYYGDTLVDLNSDTASASLIMAQVTSASSIAGDVSGRFLATASDGPSGIFQYRFHPPNGRPAMVVHHGEVFSGWFRAKSIFDPVSGKALFTHTRPDGTLVFGPGLHLANDALLGADVNTAKRSMRVEIPAGFFKDYDNTAVATTAQRALLGFFGPHAGAKKTCWNPAGGPYHLDRLYSDQALATPIEFVGASTVGKAFIQSVNGYTGGQAVACSGTEYADYLTLNPSGVHREEQALAFRGPFQPVAMDSSGPEYIDGNPGGVGFNLTWKYLPGAAQSVAGMGVFYREIEGAYNNADELKRGGDAFRCNDFANPASFSPAFNLLTVGQGVETASIPVTNGDNLQVVICPMRPGGGYFRTAIGGGKGFDGPGGGPVEVKLSAVLNHAVGTCVPLTATHYKDGAPANAPVNITVNFNMNHSPWVGNAAALYPDNTCAVGSAITSTTIAANTQAKTVYYKSSQGTKSVIEAFVNGNHTGWTEVAAVTSSTPGGLLISSWEMDHSIGKSYFVSGKCYHIEARLHDGSQGTPTNNGSVTYVLGTSPTNGTYHTSGDCSGASATTSLTFAATEAFKVLYFKPGTTAGNAFSMTFSSGTPSGGHDYAVDSNILNHVLINPANNWNRGGSRRFMTGECVAVKAHATGANGASIDLASNQAVTISSSDGSIAFSTSNGCSTTTSTLNVTMRPNQWGDDTSDVFYVKFNAGVGSNPSLTASIGAVLTSFVMLPDALHLRSNMNAGYESHLINGYCQQVTFEARYNGSPASAPVPFQVQLGAMRVSDNGPVSVYSDATCTTTMSQISFAVGENTTRQLYVQSASNIDVTARFDSGGGGGSGGSAGPSDTTLSLAIVTPSLTLANGPWVADECVPVTYDLGTLAPQAISVEFSQSDASNLFAHDGISQYFYSDPTCSTGVPANTSTVSIVAGLGSATTWVKMVPSGYTSGTFMVGGEISGFTSSTKYNGWPSACFDSSHGTFPNQCHP